MKLYSLEPQTAVIEHPNDPDLKWEVSEPQMADIIAWQESVAKATSDIDRFNKTLDLLCANTRRITGLKDADEKPMTLEKPFEPQQLAPFFGHRFDTMTPGLVVAKDEKDLPIKDENGEFRLIPGDVRGQFPTYVVNKLSEAETFSGPLAGTTPSTSSSTSS